MAQLAARQVDGTALGGSSGGALFRLLLCRSLVAVVAAAAVAAVAAAPPLALSARQRSPAGEFDERASELKPKGRPAVAKKRSACCEERNRNRKEKKG